LRHSKAAKDEINTQTLAQKRQGDIMNLYVFFEMGKWAEKGRLIDVTCQLREGHSGFRTYHYSFHEEKNILSPRLHNA
jgi:hypothetical protein